MDLASATLPEGPVAGSVNGQGFRCEHATLKRGDLLLLQGDTAAPEQALRISLFAQDAAHLSGKAVTIAPNRTPPLPQVSMLWRDERSQPVTNHFSGGYALRLIFGQAANGRMPGKIFICLPDEAKSFAAGTFNAELKRP